MKKTLTFLLIAVTTIASAQLETVYETGKDSPGNDRWTGWENENTNVISARTIGIGVYEFSMTEANETFVINLSRKFTVTGTPIRATYNVTAKDAELRLQYSTDGVTYTTIEKHAYGAATSVNEFYSDYAPTVGTYYIRLQLEGETGASNSAKIASFKLEASTANTIGLEENAQLIFSYFNNQIQVSNAGKEFNLDVYNVNGQRVMTSTTVNTDLSELNKGIYFIRYTDIEKNSQTIKVIR